MLGPLGDLQGTSPRRCLSARKGVTSVYEIQVTGKINISLEVERPHSDNEELFKELNDKS